MKFWSGIMQSFKFAWRFKCTLEYHFIPKSFIGIQYVIHVFFYNMNSKRNYKNLNQQIVINFWMTRLLSYFQEFIFQSFFCCRIKTCKQEPRLFPYLWLFILKYFQNILGIICLTLSIWIKVSKSSTSITRE
jgi:hypothetical protein